jgi:hypothetical protein
MQTTIERSTRSFAVPNTGFLEWEDTPSFAESLRERIQWVGSAPRGDARLAALRRLLAELGPEMLADAMRLGADDDVRAAAVHHADTVPCELGPAVPITPFVEPIDGVAVREVSDADLFRHFFGR